MVKHRPGLLAFWLIAPDEGVQDAGRSAQTIKVPGTI